MTIEQPAQRAGEPSVLRQLGTAPNLLSLLRLALVPVFLWLLLGPREDGLALLILMFAGFTDWLDGKLARWLNQMSRLGQLLDPAADRLYIMAILIAFLLRDILPWWVIAALVGREVVLLVCVLVLRRHNFSYPEVTYVGKGATFVLMYAFPLLLLVQGDMAGTVGALVEEVVRPLAHAFMIWGGVLYVWSGVLYAVQTWLAVQRRPLATDGEPTRREGPMTVPDELRYTAEHEWVATRDGGAVRIGITAYAQDQLGDVVFVELPEAGETITIGEVFGEVESTKSVSELFGPIDGEVAAVNGALSDAPELINSDPYGDGWLIEITPAEGSSTDGLLDAAAYQQLIED